MCFSNGITPNEGQRQRKVLPRGRSRAAILSDADALTKEAADGAVALDSDSSDEDDQHPTIPEEAVVEFHDDHDIVTPVAGETQHK